MTIGIDPGLHGAIAVHGKDGYYAEEMPIMSTGGKGKNCINPVGVVDILRTMGKQTVYLERVNARPGQGVSSVFSLGDSYGCIRGVVLAIGFPLVIVTPQTWKKHYRLTSDKEKCRARAMELFPEENFNRKKDVDRAEALLIAYYGESQ